MAGKRACRWAQADADGAGKSIHAIVLVEDHPREYHFATGRVGCERRAFALSYRSLTHLSCVGTGAAHTAADGRLPRRRKRPKGGKRR